MSVRRELVLRICPDEHSIQVEDINDGVTSFKEIALETFYDCVRHSIRHEGVRSGFLPQNCFHVGVSENGERDFCLWHPYLRADISYFGTEYPDFPAAPAGVRIPGEPGGQGARLPPGRRGG